MVKASSSAAVASFGVGGGNQSLCWPAPRQSCFVFIARAIVFVCAPVGRPALLLSLPSPNEGEGKSVFLCSRLSRKRREKRQVTSQ